MPGQGKIFLALVVLSRHLPRYKLFMQFELMFENDLILFEIFEFSHQNHNILLFRFDKINYLQARRICGGRNRCVI